MVRVGHRFVRRFIRRPVTTTDIATGFRYLAILRPPSTSSRRLSIRVRVRASVYYKRRISVGRESTAGRTNLIAE